MTTIIRLRRRELSIGAIAILAAFVAVFIPSSPLGRRAAAEQPTIGTPEFHDSHFHLTNYVQQGTRRSSSWRSWATRVGRSTLFGIPLQQQWSYANSGDFAPTYYLQTDAPLYYYSFTDAFIASVVPGAAEGRAGAVRPDDHRLQPGRHVRRRPHPACAHDVPRRLHRHRRVQHPQGVRLVEDRRRDRQPAPTRRSTGSSHSRRRPASSSSCTTTSTCRSARSTPSRSTSRR